LPAAAPLDMGCFARFPSHVGAPPRGRLGNRLWVAARAATLGPYPPRPSRGKTLCARTPPALRSLDLFASRRLCVEPSGLVTAGHGVLQSFLRLWGERRSLLVQRHVPPGERRLPLQAAGAGHRPLGMGCFVHFVRRRDDRVDPYASASPCLCTSSPTSRWTWGPSLIFGEAHHKTAPCYA
jgi:hypothetical protein